MYICKGANKSEFKGFITRKIILLVILYRILLTFKKCDWGLKKCD